MARNRTEYSKQYRNKNLKIICEKSKQFRKNNPWMESFYKLYQRCNNKNCKDYHRYGLRGIKAEITKQEIEILWFRDKAYEMLYPTIDRIDNDGNYCFKNCQWIENSINARKDKYIKKINQYDLNGNFIKEWNSQIEIMKTLSYYQSQISRAINLNRQAYGFYWRNSL